MALSQIQCLDDNHVNPRTTESKPEFLYCEDQRLALEALLRDGREAFVKYLQARGLRGFLSDLELENLAGVAEPYDPGSQLFPEGAEDDEPPLSLHYWPELSDTSVPQMDIGWPDSEAYRGVTRTTVYTQPPLDGHAHIKEVVRKMIAQAQKVIAVVMDVFTDVDIFRDLLDAGFKRRVSVYILLERTTVPHFLSMCQRANMHAGHLKHLRVRCSEGSEFYTRSCTKVRGQLGHRFMFVDGDKAVSGSYSFTWTSSRLDRNLITVVTGQAVDAFDRLFRFLYMTSNFVDLRQLATAPEPEPEPVVQKASVAPPSAALARKLYSAKYALVVTGNPSMTPSAGTGSPKESQKSDSNKTDDPVNKRRRRKKESENAAQQAPPLHPGLIDLEKACLITYLPTWPEPDPPSDVIGFINIRDASKPTQVHLQRSEMFETSQAIRFSSPITVPKEKLPAVAQPRQHAATAEEVNKLQPTRDETKAGGSAIDHTRPTQLSAWPKTKDTAAKQKSSTFGQKSEPGKATAQALNTEGKMHSNTDQNAGHGTTVQLSASTPPQRQPLSGPNAVKEAEASSVRKSNGMHRTHTPSDPADSNPGQRIQTKTDSHIYTQTHNCSEMTRTPTDHSHVSTASASENNHIPIHAVHSRTATSVCTSVPSTNCSLPPLTSSAAAQSHPLPQAPASSSLTSSPPVPKPRTVQLVFKDNGGGGGQKLPEISVVRRPESTGPPAAHSQPDEANAARAPPQKESETVPHPRNGSGGKAGAQRDAENTGRHKDTPQQKQSATPHGAKGEETVGLRDDSAAGTKPKAVLIADAPKADGVNIQELVPKEAEPKSPTSTGRKASPKTETDTEKASEKKPAGCEFAKVPNEKGENAMERKTHLAKEPQRISTHASPSPTADTHTPQPGGDDSTHTQASAQSTDTKPNTANRDTHVTHPEECPQAARARGSSQVPDRSLHLSLPDTHGPDPPPPSAPPRTPTPDGFSPRTPTPDFRTPTPDGRASPRQDSNLSTTSEEYFECSDSPFREDVGVSTSSSLLEKVKEATNEENGREEGETEIVAERRTERGSQKAEGRGSGDANRAAQHLKQAKESSTEVVEKDEGQPQTPKRKRAPNQPTAQRESASKATDAKRVSTGGLKPERASSDRGTLNREKVANKASLRPSSVERRERPQSAGETEGQKLSHPPRAPRPLSATQPSAARSSGSRPLGQAESKVLQGAPPPPRPPPPPPSAGRRQPEVPHGQQSGLPSRQPRPGQSQNQQLCPSRPASFLHTHNSNVRSQLQPQSSNQTVSAREAQKQQEEEAARVPFTLTFSRLYSLKGLKDKMSKLPAQSRRGSTSSAAQGRKSTG